MDSMKYEELDQKLQEQASNYKATLLGYGVELHKIPRNYRRYLLQCGHEQDIKYRHMAVGKFRCRECTKSKYEIAATEIDAEIIEHLPLKEDADYKKYKLRCGHIKLMAPYNLNASCAECNENLISNKLREVGLTAVSKHSQGYAYKFNTCGHVQNIKRASILNNNIPKCIECARIRHQEEAESAGLKYTRKTSVKDGEQGYYNEYILPCGCLKLIKPGNVRKNSWGCEIHSNYWNKEAVLYLIEFKTEKSSWLKLGVTSNIGRRISDYKINTDYKHKILLVRTFESLHNAEKAEKEIHRKHSKVKVPSDRMKEFMRSGYTECYPLEFREQLLQEIEGIEIGQPVHISASQ